MFRHVWDVEGKECSMGVTQEGQELGMGASGGKKKGCKEHRTNTRMRTLPNKGVTRNWLSKEECFSQKKQKSKCRVVGSSLLCVGCSP